MERIIIIYSFEKFMEVVICKVVQTLIGIQAFWFLLKTKETNIKTLIAIALTILKNCKLIECLQISISKFVIFHLIGTTIYL